MTLEIAGALYQVSEHPVAKGAPYGQQGRKGTVYQLAGAVGKRALKVFVPAFREPALVAVAECIGAYAAIPGLAACDRTVLTVRRHRALLQQYDDLTYAVVMPWIAGTTWAEQMANPNGLTPEQGAAAAASLTRLLTDMEERGLAHCDLSGANLLLSWEGGTPRAELVDLEEMFAPGLHRPPAPSAGSPGYAHSLAHTGLWSREADRFAGAVLLAEVLGWCVPRVRQAAWGESYFDPREMHQDAERSRLLMDALRERWGENVARLFERAWQADVLRECPTFGEWSVALAGSAAGTPLAESGPTAVLTDRLFDDGAGAMRCREYAKARELLAEVVRRDPQYQRNGQDAALLLAEAERHRAPPSRPAGAPTATPRPQPPRHELPRSEAPGLPESSPPAPDRTAPGLVAGVFEIARGVTGSARPSGPADVPPPTPILPDSRRIATALRAQELRLAQIPAPHPQDDGSAVAALRTAVRYLREKIEFSFPPAVRLRASPQYGEFALQVELFCQDLAAISGGAPDSVRVQEAKYLADALRAEAEVLVRSLRKG